MSSVDVVEVRSFARLDFASAFVACLLACSAGLHFPGALCLFSLDFRLEDLPVFQQRGSFPRELQF